MSDFESMCRSIIKQALNQGADEAEVYLETGRESEVGTRLGEIEIVKESFTQGLGLRIFKNQSLGFSYTSNFKENQINVMIKKTIELAEQATRDEDNGLPEPSSDAIPDLQLFDPEIAEIKTAAKIDACRKMEKTLFDYDKRLDNSEGAFFFDGDSVVHIANSRDFYHSFKNSYIYTYCLPVARQDGKLQAGFWFSFTRYFKDLESPESVAKTAAERTIRMLGASTPKTTQAPVVFDPYTAASIIAIIAEAVNGDNIFKRSSFLVDRIADQVAAPAVNIRDDGRLNKGPGSSPVDGEGLPTRNKEIIHQGRLATYLYDTYTARKSKAQSTANAQRDYSSTPEIGNLNFFLEAGRYSPEDIIGSVKSGLYVTNMMGTGIDIVTGDYSRGASGIWIENGKLTEPVEGITIAGNMLNMLQGIEMIGSDLKMLGPISSPTIKIAEMMVAGT
jgi:PmbA protein